MSTITREFTKEQLIAHITPKLARIKPDSQVNDNLRNEALMNKRVLEIALAALTAEPAKCGHVNLDCDDGKAVCLSCGKVWEV